MRIVRLVTQVPQQVPRPGTKKGGGREVVSLAGSDVTPGRTSDWRLQSSCGIRLARLPATGIRDRVAHRPEVLSARGFVQPPGACRLFAAAGSVLPGGGMVSNRRRKLDRSGVHCGRDGK